MSRLPKLTPELVVWSLVGILGAVLLVSEAAVRAKALSAAVDALSGPEQPVTITMTGGR